MELRYPPEAEAYRADVRAFLDAHLPDGWTGVGAIPPEESDGFLIRWRKTLHEHGFLGITWPVDYGGQSRSKIEQVVLVEEFARRGAPTGTPNDTFGVKMIGNTLLRWGTEPQRRRFLPRILSGDDVWCQGYSEPDAGSDLATLVTRAAVDGDEIVINGQKIWTSNAHLANWIFVLVRTDPVAPRHHGISFVLVPLDQQGVEIRPIAMMNGDREFSETFFSEARTPLDNVVGGLNNGWAVAMTLLEHERGEEAAINPVMFRHELDRLIMLAGERGVLGDPRIRQRLAWCHTKVETMRFLGYRILTGYLRDGGLGPVASVSKLYWSEYHQIVTDLALEVLGAEALVSEGRPPPRAYRTDDPGAPNSSASWLGARYNATAGTIYAGTSQVQRNILAESVLGLPRDPYVP